MSAGFALVVLDRLLDSRDREVARRKVEDFWYRTATMELYEQFQHALRSRYFQMRRLQRLFIGTFLLIAMILVFYNTASGIVAPTSSFVEGQQKTIDFDFNIRRQFFLAYIDIVDEVPSFGDVDGQCTIGEGFASLREIYRLGTIKSNLSRFLESQKDNTVAIRVYNGLVSCTVILLLTIPLVVGLYLSFTMTLWLLSRFTQSRLGAVLIVVADLAIALVMPLLLSGLFLSLLAFAAIFYFGTVPDYSLFEHPTWNTLWVSSVGMLLALSLGVPIIFSLFASLFPIWAAVPFIATSTVAYSYQNLKTLVTDMGRVLMFDLNIGPGETLINWAIVLDILFSLTYIIPCLSLVLMQRSPTTRRLFLNLVQWIAEHPSGPLIATSEIFTSFAKYLTGLFKRGD